MKKSIMYIVLACAVVGTHAQPFGFGTLNKTSPAGADIVVEISPKFDAVLISHRPSLRLDRFLFVAYGLNGKIAAIAPCKVDATGILRGFLASPLSKGVYLYSLKEGKKLLASGKTVAP